MASTVRAGAAFKQWVNYAATGHRDFTKWAAQSEVYLNAALEEMNELFRCFSQDVRAMPEQVPEFLRVVMLMFNASQVAITKEKQEEIELRRNVGVPIYDKVLNEFLSVAHKVVCKPILLHGSRSGCSATNSHFALTVRSPLGFVQPIER